MELHDCGYWSVCEDHGCACAISDNVDGFDNDIYQKWKLDHNNLSFFIINFNLNYHNCPY